MRHIYQSHVYRRLVSAAFVIVGLLAVQLSLWPADCVAQEATNSKAFAGHLSAGEFGPAQEIALKQADTGQRDRMLQEMARFQAQMGSFNASIATSALIQNDRNRTDSLGSVRTQQAVGSMGRGNSGRGGMGGASQADFDPLIDLIQTTVAPDSWDEVGGPGSMQEFRSGVFVDASGTLKRLETKYSTDGLAGLRSRSMSSASPGSSGDIKSPSRLRKVSLTRLEKQVQLLSSLGHKPDQAMLHLAGLTKIEYVFVYPETGDIVIAGPAGDWTVNEEGRSINSTTGAPVLQLDDLVVCLRNSLEKSGKFGCSIDPRRSNLEAAQRFLASTNLQKAKQREELRSVLGQQDISVDGIDPSSRVAQVIVEADYLMKLVGMDLEAGVLGVDSYLDLVSLDDKGNPPPADVVRWWFTLNYDAITTTRKHDGYQLNGKGVKVLSESEILTETGERKHTGRSSGPAAEFAHGFTDHFEKLAIRHPIFAELRNVFDIALVSSLIQNEHLADQVDWHLTFFGQPTETNQDVYQVERRDFPMQVDSILNHRIIDHRKNGKRFRTAFVAVSGGVVADFSQLTSSASIQPDKYGLMKNERDVAQPKDLGATAWWWD